MHNIQRNSLLHYLMLACSFFSPLPFGAVQLFLFCFESVCFFSLSCLLHFTLSSFIWLINLIYSISISIAHSGVGGFSLCTCVNSRLLFHFSCFHCTDFPYSCLHHTDDVIAREKNERKNSVDVKC